MRTCLAHRVSWALAAAGLLAGSALAGPLTTEFTFQGRFLDGGFPVNANSDFRLTLWDSAVGGIAVAGPVTFLNEPVNNGLFNIDSVDFGAAAFDGDERWIQVEARTPTGVGGFTPLAPRQPVKATPYALQTRGLFVDAALNVGVGTTSPSALLNVGDGEVHVDFGGTRAYRIGNNAGPEGLVAVAENTTTGQLTSTLGTSQLGDGAGFFQARNRDGVRMAQLWADSDGVNDADFPAQFFIRSTGGGPGGEIQLQNDDGAARLQAFGGGTGDGSVVDMFNGAGDQTILLDAEAGTGGDIQMFNDAGILTIDLDSDFGDAGQVGVTNGVSSSAKIELDGDGASDDGGEVDVRAADGSSTIHLDGQEADNAGAIEVRNNVSSTRVFIDGEDFGAGRIDVRQDDGTNGIALRGEEFSGGGNGSVFEMFAEDGTEVVEIDSGFASNSGVNLFVDGDINATGAKNAVVTVGRGERRLMYCTESTEVWFEEVGSGQLQNGFAEITLDPLFRQAVTINDANPMRVLITLTDECNGVYVKKHADRFTVHELMDGKSDATFDYKVICKRSGYETVRMERFVRPGNDDPLNPGNQSMYIPTEGLGDPTDGAARETDPTDGQARPRRIEERPAGQEELQPAGVSAQDASR
jgi:hypothetical protein